MKPPDKTCNMKRSVLLITIFICSLGLKAQERKDLAISLSTGLLNSPYYQKAKARSFYGFDLDYNLSRRRLLSVNYFGGDHTYYENGIPNDPLSYIREDGTNAQGNYHNFSVLFKYKLYDNNIFSLTPGAGAGILTHKRQFPYQEATSSYLRTSSWSALVFPVKVDVHFKLLKNLQTGITTGFLVHPDYPILALHGGPKLTYVIR